MSWEDDLRHQDNMDDPNRPAPWSHVIATIVGWLGLVGCLMACGWCLRGC